MFSLSCCVDNAQLLIIIHIKLNYIERNTIIIGARLSIWLIKYWVIIQCIWPATMPFVEHFLCFELETFEMLDLLKFPV